MKKIKYLIIGLFSVFLLGCATNRGIINPNNPNIEFVRNNQGVLIRTLDRDVKLFIPSPNMRAVNERGGGGQNNPNYFYFVDRNVRGISTELHFSGWLLPIEKFKYDHVAEFWLEVYGESYIFNHDIREVDNWQAFLFDVPVPPTFVGVSSSHMRANLLHGDTWIDLHLSITDRRPSEVLHNILFDYLKTLEIIN